MAGQRPEAGVQAVDGLAAGQHPIDDVARRADVDQCPFVEFHAGAAAGDGEYPVHRQPITAENDRLAC